jgi:hypothetical protein
LLLYEAAPAAQGLEGLQPRAPQGLQPRLAAQGLQPLFAAQGLQPRFAAQGLHPRFAAQGLHPRFAAQGLQPLFAAQGLQAFLAAQGLQPFWWWPATAFGASTTVARVNPAAMASGITVVVSNRDFIGFIFGTLR